MKTVTRRSIVGVCLLGLVAGACLSPTLPPLPPPGAPELSYVAPGQLQLSGMVSSRRSTRVIAVNINNDQVAGEIVRDGTYRFVLGAEPGHRIELWYEVGADVSDSLFLTAPDYDGVTDAGASITEVSASDAGATDAAASAAPVPGDEDAALGE